MAAQPGFAVVGECGTADEALGILNVSAVDILLLDLDSRSQSGEEFISAARHAGYQGRILIVAGEMAAEDLSATLQLGVSGIFLKSEVPDRLVQAIRMVASGAVWLDQRTMRLLADQLAERSQSDAMRPGNCLTEREERVLSGILGGLTNRKIGDHIGISESAVKSVVQQLFVRAGVRTRSQLVRAALEGSLGTRRLLKRSAT